MDLYCAPYQVYGRLAINTYEPNCEHVIDVGFLNLKLQINGSISSWVKPTPTRSISIAAIHSSSRASPRWSSFLSSSLLSLLSLSLLLQQ